MGRSKSGLNKGNDSGDEAWDEGGSMGMKEKEVGLVLDCNRWRGDVTAWTCS